MAKNSFVTVTIRGGVLKATNKTSEEQKAAQKKASKRRPKPHVNASYKERCTGTLSRGVQRCKVGLAQAVGIIENRPTCHVSVVLPKRVDANFEHSVLKDCLQKFFKRVTRIYPRCYFVRFYGWTPDAGLHAHILIRFGKKNPRQQKERELQEIWSDIVESYDSGLLKLTKFQEDGTISYITSLDVDKELRVVINRIHGGRVWSVINKRNIRQYKKVILELTAAEDEVFKNILRELFEKYGLVKSNSEQLKKNSYCLNYLTPRLLRLAVKKFLNWRKRHGA
jgi:hypothetical protein